MGFDAEAFSAWLQERGTPVPFVKPYLDGARKVVDVVGFPMDQAQLKAFLAGLATTGEVSETRVANYKRIAAALLRFQARQQKLAAKAAKQARKSAARAAARGIDLPPASTDGADGAPVGTNPGGFAAPADDRPSFSNLPAEPPWPPVPPPREAPVMRSPPPAPPGRVFAGGLGDLVADGDVARGEAGGRKGQVRFLDMQRLPDPGARRRVFMIAATVLASLCIGLVFKQTVDAFKYRSRAVTPNHYSEHLSLEVGFPPTLGWRHLTGGDRTTTYDSLYPPISGRSETQDVYTAAFFRGQNGKRPELGMAIVLVPLLVDMWNAPSGPEAGLLAYGEEVARLTAEKVVLPGGKFSTGPCAYVRSGNPVVTCPGEIALGRETWQTPTFVVYGRDRAAVVVFRSLSLDERKREEIRAIAMSVRP